ncbi:putative DNA (cytosine-5)-methyltransferase CMT1 [Senna tora]|uniref:DNA (cytosine-5-)-methyltransferase n=1 Tax=Senna tora TaxID=362788 RepID=A0A834SSE9_9FABA|nr:putative DNA (cytosine-5)-methyltransferase CMT1 [Senna tora]
MGKRRDVEDEANDTVSLVSSHKKPKRPTITSEASFVGKPIPLLKAKQHWPKRYEHRVIFLSSSLCFYILNSSSVLFIFAFDVRSRDPSQKDGVLLAKCHYNQAIVDGVVYNLYEDAYVKGEDGKPDYIARIVEFFETDDKEKYFAAQWFYRAEDTVIKDHANLVDKSRVFISDVKDDNPLDCIVSKVKIAQVDLSGKKKKMPPCDLYYNMKYTVPYLTFSNLTKVNEVHSDHQEIARTASDTSSTISSESGSNVVVDGTGALKRETDRSDMPQCTLLDLYSGCGAMSTGLCMGASISGVKLVTRWAVDINPHACKSLKLNHPETQVRNEAAEDFLSLLKAWYKLCKDHSLLGTERSESIPQVDEENIDEEDEGDKMKEEASADSSDSEDFEVQKLLAICHGDPNNVKKPGLYFKVRWKGYGPSEDTWEPIDGLSNCQECLKDFITTGYKKKLLPLPGDVDLICGGPPCQGVSGFNRFRNQQAPLEDIKNRQLVVFMDIIEYLKPKYVLMENVVDILKFAGGFLGRYAIGRLVAMNYQARMGIMTAGSYGLPQFRMRVFLWGALPTEKLPQYPLPTHEVKSRGFAPCEFEEITVAYDTKEKSELAGALTLEDAISDLPSVTNDEGQDEMKYGKAPRTDFQKYIRLRKNDMVSFPIQSQPQRQILYDHRPLQLNKDDFQRVCRIPKKKGANFRDLPGVLVNSDKKVEWDPSIERVMLESGKPLVPDYAMSFVRGTSQKPFGRLWWDEIVPTVVGRAEPHNQIILHPAQDRVLTIRENARLQGFPDCYKLSGPIKERYIQVGNAVAVPVALSLGFTFGMAFQGLSDDKPLTKLRFKFPTCIARSSSPSIHDEDDDDDST